MKPEPILSQHAHEQIEALAKELLGTQPWLGIVSRTVLALLWLASSRHEDQSRSQRSGVLDSMIQPLKPGKVLPISRNSGVINILVQPTPRGSDSRR